MIIVETPEFLAFTLKSDRNPAPGSVKGVFTAAPIRSSIPIPHSTRNAAETQAASLLFQQLDAGA
jgi:hypothetical protein